MADQNETKLQFRDGTKLTTVFYAPRYMPYVQPDGYLIDHIACHALFHYYLAARRTYETHEKDIVVYEGDPDPQYNYKQLFTSIAQMYNAKPEEMVKFWPNVDAQCMRLKLPKLPDDDGHRFNKIPEIK